MMLMLTSWCKFASFFKLAMIPRGFNLIPVVRAHFMFSGCLGVHVLDMFTEPEVLQLYLLILSLNLQAHTISWMAAFAIAQCQQLQIN